MTGLMAAPTTPRSPSHTRRSPGRAATPPIRLTAATPPIRSTAATPLLVGAAWAAAELARGRLLNGTLTYVGNSPWATLGYSQAGWPAILQIASLTGVYGVSFVLAAVNAALAEVVAAALRREPVARGAWIGCGLAAGCAALAVAWGTLVRPESRRRTRRADRDRPGQPRRGGPLERGRSGAHARDLRASHAQVLARGPVATVYWPESALTTFIEQDEPTAGRSPPLGDHDAELLIGRARRRRTRRPYTNSVYVVAADGRSGRATTKSASYRSWNTFRPARSRAGTSDACASSVPR